MKPFDLEAAKRGEPICLISLSANTTIPVRFVGTRSDGRVVIETTDGGSTYTYDAEALVMAPNRVTLYVVTWWYRGKPLLDPCFWFTEKVHAETYVAGVKSKYGEHGNKWDHPVIPAVEVSE